MNITVNKTGIHTYHPFLNMKNDVFYISNESGTQDIHSIRMKNCELNIRVYPLNKVNYQEPFDKIVVYGNNNGDPLAFELSEDESADCGITLDAIRWYSSYLNNPEMKILREDPRFSY